MESLKENITVLGTTRSGKYIHKDPKQNEGFKKQDHMDAYRAHAKFLMHNQLAHTSLESHLQAMNEHYLRAVNAQ